MMAVESMGAGVLTMIQSICTALSGEFEFTVLYGVRDETPDDLSGFFDDSVTLIPWRVEASIDPKQDVAALRSLKAAVREVEPDVLHAFSSKAGALARIAYPTGRTPVCYSPSGYSFLRVDIGPIARAAFFAIEKLLGLTRSLTVACGHGELQLARRMSRHAIAICNFFELPPDVTPTRDYSSTRPMRVVSVGRIAPQKDFPLFCQIAERMQGSQIAFQWVGDGDVPAGCTVPPNVESTGWLPHERTLEMIAAADVYIQTSRYEGLPVTILEAQALGRPVLATPVIGNEELVVEGENGYLCATAESFADKLASLSKDESEWRYLARTAELMSQDYCAERIVKRWRSLYRHFGSYLERS
jgi:glycosyltransferase involved in cell wall biosynthesis